MLFKNCSFISFFLLFGVLAGCAQKFTPVVTPGPGEKASASAVSSSSGRLSSTHVASVAASAAVEPAAPPSGTQDATRLSQCTRELDALRQFNSTKYSTYKAELERITHTGAQYLAVSGGISQDINDLVQPRYQYALTSLCQQVRTDLSNSLVNQVTIK